MPIATGNHVHATIASHARVQLSSQRVEGMRELALQRWQDHPEDQWLGFVILSSGEFARHCEFYGWRDSLSRPNTLPLKHLVVGPAALRCRFGLVFDRRMSSRTLKAQSLQCAPAPARSFGGEREWRKTEIGAYGCMSEALGVAAPRERGL
jgi:hypothetical protein